MIYGCGHKAVRRCAFGSQADRLSEGAELEHFAR